jgi:hemerythrin
MDETEMVKLFNRLGLIVANSELSNAEIRAVLVKLTLLASIHAITKEEFMHSMDVTWEMEKFFHPESNEMH